MDECWAASAAKTMSHQKDHVVEAMRKHQGETSSRSAKLHVPLGSRLVMITRHEDHWRIWTGINDKNMPIRKALGTFIKLYPNGEAHTMTIRVDGEETMQVMEARDG